MRKYSSILVNVLLVLYFYCITIFTFIISLMFSLWLLNILLMFYSCLLWMFLTIFFQSFKKYFENILCLLGKDVVGRSWSFLGYCDVNMCFSSEWVELGWCSGVCALLEVKSSGWSGVVGELSVLSRFSGGSCSSTSGCLSLSSSFFAVFTTFRLLNRLGLTCLPAILSYGSTRILKSRDILVNYVLSSRYYGLSWRSLRGQSCWKFDEEVNTKVCEVNQ